MRRLLTTTAVLFALIGSAQAGDHLPKALVGGWCATGQVTYTDDDTWSHSTYRRSTRRACGERDWLQMRTRGYVNHSGEDVICRFVSVRTVWTAGGEQYHFIAARCRAEESGWYGEEMMFSLSDGVLTDSVKLRGL